MKKLEELKINLIIWNRTKSTSKAYEICEMLYGELVERGKTTNATHKKDTIEKRKTI